MSIFTDEGTGTKLRHLAIGQEFRMPHVSTVYKLEREDGMYWQVSWFDATDEGNCSRRTGVIYIGQEVQRVNVKKRT